MHKPGTVYIVHHVDTEGPLAEPLAETFKRAENTFGIILDVPRTKEGLAALQAGTAKLPDASLAPKIQAILGAHALGFKEDWKAVREMLHRVMSQEFRRKLKDSDGNGWIYNWHIMDHVGFETNERGRDLGYLKIFEEYEKLIKETGSREDAVHWHFHPISFLKEAHIPATSYENSYRELHQVICRRLIDKRWFPRVNRAGFHSERPDSHWFLEQWLPFDPSNQAVETKGIETQKDAINGRFGDWSGAPSDWSVYRPDIYDWRKSGNANRVIARVLNMQTRFRNIDATEIERAFQKAKNGENVYLGITNHDWREMSVETDGFRELLSEVAARFPDVQYRFSEAVDAFRNVLGYEPETITRERIDLDCVLDGDVMTIRVTNGEPFGPQPYLAIKTTNGDYFHDNLDFGAFKKEYFYTLDRYTVQRADVEAIAVASNDIYGNTCICTLTFKNGQISEKSFQ